MLQDNMFQFNLWFKHFPFDSPVTMPAAMMCATLTGSGIALRVVESLTISSASSLSIP